MSYLSEGTAWQQEQCRIIEETPCVNWPTPYYQQAANMATLEGLKLEFGVAKGHSIRELAKWFDEIHGFDTFTGLPVMPEDGQTPWRSGQFSNGGEFPEVPPNVKLYKGLIQDKLMPFLKTRKDPVSFLHLDADIYSATKFVLEALIDRIVPGTIICFDELYGFHGCFRQEFKAWEQTIQTYGLSYNYLFRTDITKPQQHFNGIRPKIGAVTLIID